MNKKKAIFGYNVGIRYCRNVEILDRFSLENMK